MHWESQEINGEWVTQRPVESVLGESRGELGIFIPSERDAETEEGAP